MKGSLLAVILLLLAWSVTGAAQPGLKLTEIQFDVPAGTAGDANGDTQRSPRGDEFIELYNSSSDSIDLSAYQVIEREGVAVFTFPIGTVLQPGKYIVVFGGLGAAGLGASLPAGQTYLAIYPTNYDQGFGPVTTSTGGTKTNLSNTSDRIMIVNSLLADTVAEVFWGGDTAAGAQYIAPFTANAVYLAGTNTIDGDTISGAIGQSVTIQQSTGKWGLHSAVAGDPVKLYSPGAPAEGATAVGEQAGAITPGSFRLRQNYPNPFNPSTVIGFELGSASDVRLDVYNILGERVAALLDKRLGAGQYVVNFDASTLAAGIYLYTLEAGNKRETKKMTLIR